MTSESRIQEEFYDRLLYAVYEMSNQIKTITFLFFTIKTKGDMVAGK